MNSEIKKVIYPFSKFGKNKQFKENMNICQNIIQKKKCIKKLIFKNFFETEDIKLFKNFNLKILKKKKRFSIFDDNLNKNININSRKSESFENIKQRKKYKSLNNIDKINIQNISQDNTKNIKRRTTLAYDSSLYNTLEIVDKQSTNNLYSSVNKKIYIPPLDFKFKQESTTNISNIISTNKNSSFGNSFYNINNNSLTVRKSASSINLLRNKLKLKINEYEKENMKKNKLFINLISERLYHPKMNKINFKYGMTKDFKALDIKIKKKNKEKFNPDKFKDIMTQEYDKRNQRLKRTLKTFTKKIYQWNNKQALDYIDVLYKDSDLLKLKQKNNFEKKYFLCKRESSLDEKNRQKLCNNSRVISYLLRKIQSHSP